MFKHEDLPVQTIVLHTSVKGQPDKENFPDSEFDTPSSAVRPSQQIEQRDFAELRKRDSMDFSKKGFAGSVAGSSLGTLEGESDLEPQMIRVINEKFLSVDLSPDNKTFVTITRKRWIVRHTLSQACNAIANSTDSFFLGVQLFTACNARSLYDVPCPYTRCAPDCHRSLR